MKKAKAKAVPAKAGAIFNPLHPAPQPVDVDVRICFGIAWYASEEDAQKADEVTRKQGNTYNGGFYHGVICGREESWDREVDGKKRYAVTF